MRLATIALASAFALSSTLAVAGSTSHHHKYKSGVRTQQGTVGMSSARSYGSYGSYRQYGGSSNNRPGLVGGADVGTYKP
jgi:hypothetical protein